jgi:hypothetical protein
MPFPLTKMHTTQSILKLNSDEPYYPTPPTQNDVYIAQVQALTGGGFGARVAALQQQSSTI